VMQCFPPAAPDWLDRIERAARDFARECKAVATPRSPVQGNS
jgi:hypothetical protein